MSAFNIGRARMHHQHCLLLLESTSTRILSPSSTSTPTFLTRSQQIPKLQRYALHRRAFSQTRSARAPKRPEDEAFTSRLGKAWRNTKIEWKPIPIGLGIGFLGFYQFYRTRARDSARGEGEADADNRPAPKRQRIYPTGGGWQVSIMSTLPLKALSRVWGRFNELTIPYYLRVPGFKLYGWIFGVNFDEIAEPDLHVFPNLAAFFYREIKPGARPLDPNPQALLSPADGKVLQFGTIEGGEVEQIKGMTYSLDALLGKAATAGSTKTSPNPQSPDNIFQQGQSLPKDDPEAIAIRQDQEFANVNGISYTLPNIFSGSDSGSVPSTKPQSPSSKSQQDASVSPKSSSESAVQADLTSTDASSDSTSSQQPWWSPFSNPATEKQLYYIVVYLAPGDYHRFHSPVSWVCQSRRHFAGELYSVSPYVQRTLPGLFTLNERVVLLGRWKHGFFSYIPVGATNVGSIKINFDRELRTNSLLTDTQADREAAAAAERGEPYSGYSEATYTKASKLLGGHPLKRGEEMGGFQLGSSIVMVFEAPVSKRVNSLDDGGLEGAVSKGGFKWNVDVGQKVQVGQALGWVEVEDD